jgi:hypothetical protein
MTTDTENDLSNIIIDEEHSMNLFFDGDPSYRMNNNQGKSTTKRLKPMLKCVVCGDNAFGKIDLFCFSSSYFFISIRVQF